MEVNAVASRNAPSPILVNLEPTSNIIEVKAVAPLNALAPMLVTVAGMVMDVNFDAFLNVK